MHELTIRLYKLPKEHSKEQVDSIIRQYLTEKRNHILGKYVEGRNYLYPHHLDECLGLSSPEAKWSSATPKTGGKSGDVTIGLSGTKISWPKPKDSTVGEWTCHAHPMGYVCEHSFCPLCGTPRPKPKSLRETVSKEVYEYLVRCGKESFAQDFRWHLADVAIGAYEKHFKDKK